MISFNMWKESGQYFQYKDKHSIFYQTAGAGPVLLLLHGFPTASWDWHKVWEPLSQKFRLLAFDFIGFGFSDKRTLKNHKIFFLLVCYFLVLVAL